MSNKALPAMDAETKAANKKNRICDELYERLIRLIVNNANGYSRVEAWYITWHLRLEWGIPTSELNYHYSKLVNEGKLLKRSTRSYTAFSPVEIDGFIRDGDHFERAKPVEMGVLKLRDQ